MKRKIFLVFVVVGVILVMAGVIMKAKTSDNVVVVPDEKFIFEDGEEHEDGQDHEFVPNL